jgi:hypothetical protein
MTGLDFPFTYHAVVQMGDGVYETHQPGGDLPAEVVTSANQIAIASVGDGGTQTRVDYDFHEADQDWFEVNTPAGGSTLTVTWDVTGIRTTLGDFDQVANPLGSQFTLMAFDPVWFGTPGSIALPAQTIGGNAYDASAGVFTQSVSFPIASTSTNYYILFSTVNGFDLQDSYTATFTVN